MKASQVFISEWMLTTALHTTDTGRAGRGNALYVFPTQAQGDDFAQARIDSAVEQSEYLSSRVGVAPTGGQAVARVRLKRVGQGHLYIRGADQRRQLLTIDADTLLLDEVDEFKEATIPVARKRLNSSRDPRVRGASTPKFPASGIAPIWQNTTRRRYFLRCDGCGERQYLRFPDNLTREGAVVCAKCRHPLDHTSEGEWVAEDTTATVEGFWINRLYSPRADLAALAMLGYLIEDGLESDPSIVQEFWNQDLGQPHAPEGGSLSDDVLGACERDYGIPTTADAFPVTMGVDVGTVLHVWVEGPAEGEKRRRLLHAGTTPDWAELDALMRRFKVNRCVIDANPEGQKAQSFAARFPGRVYCCFYPNMADWRHKDTAIAKPEERVVLAHRTASLDANFERFFRQEIELPRNGRHVHGLYEQLKAPVRVLAKDADGKIVARYDEGNAADHYAHASNYAHVALAFAGHQESEPAAYAFGAQSNTQAAPSLLHAGRTITVVRRGEDGERVTETVPVGGKAAPGMSLRRLR